jgi:hypothetical protein
MPRSHGTKLSLENLELRRRVLLEARGTRVFIRPNPFLEGDDAVLKEYEPSTRCMIHSWTAREVPRPSRSPNHLLFWYSSSVRGECFGRDFRCHALYALFRVYGDVRHRHSIL